MLHPLTCCLYIYSHQLKRIELIEETYASDKAKLQEIRQLMAKKNR